LRPDQRGGFMKITSFIIRCARLTSRKGIFGGDEPAFMRQQMVRASADFKMYLECEIGRRLLLLSFGSLGLVLIKKL
jgi:hypothetical protein